MVDKDELRKELEAEHGKVYTTDEMTAAFEVLGFSLGYCVVRERATGKRGSLNFTHMPRFYFSFVEE